jgi:arylsulfatase A-like enzyme
MKYLAPLLFICAVSASAETKPDVLIILTDQWSPRWLSWEDPQVRTPHLDGIAGEGMIFDRCYTTSPICMPARVSLITGLYPHNAGHGLWGNILDYHVPPEEATMFRDLKAAGLTTAQIGKTHWTAGKAARKAYPALADFHSALGLDHVLDVPGPPSSAEERGPYAKYLRDLGLLEEVATDMRHRYVKWEYEPRANPAPPEHYHDRFVARSAVEFIDRQPADRPFCLVVSLHSPHPPLDAPGEFATMFDPATLELPPNVPEPYRRELRNIGHAETRAMLANYLGKIALLDRHIGDLVEAMRRRGTWGEAFFALTSDHGEMMGAHGTLSKGRFYEESARVPLVLRWPGKIPAGRTRAPVQMMDLYPTAVEAAGGTVSAGRHAKSLLPLAKGEVTSIRPAAISEIGNPKGRNVMVSDGRYKWWLDENEEFLFDLSEDPFEMKNLAAESGSTDVRLRMQRLLIDHFRGTQTNLSEGYRSKVQRLREAEAQKKSELP